jgi:hypothetical protein
MAFYWSKLWQEFFGLAEGLLPISEKARFLQWVHINGELERNLQNRLSAENI